MNVYLAYLDTMFRAYPATATMLEAKTELQGMMEDAYNSYVASGLSENEAVGRVITEFGNLDELAPVLGITAEIGAPAPTGTPAHPRITLEDAKGFAEVRRGTQKTLAIAVSLFVFSPICVLIASMLSTGDSDNLTALGLIPMLVIIAAGVVMLVGVDQKRAAYKHISSYRFATNPVVNVWATELEREHSQRRSVTLQIAVGLWILAVAPIMVFSALLPNLGGEDKGSVIGVMTTLAFVGLGLLVFLPNNWASEVAEIVTKKHGAMGDSEDESTSLVGLIASVYWPLLVVIFLAWSFIGNAWATSWIIWPIGGVLFGVIAATTGAIETYRKRR